MSSLTEIAVVAKKVALWLIIGLVAYILMKILVGFGIQYWKATHRIPISPPNTLFGKLPYPKFPESVTTSSGLSFTLQNIEGAPPETTDAGKVYFMPKKASSLLSAQKAKRFAAKLDFTDEPKELTSTLYRFIDPEETLRSLQVDITTLNFKLEYNYEKNPQIFFQGEIRSKSQAKNGVIDFVRFKGLFNENVLGGKITSDLLKFDLRSKTLQKASSLSNSNAARVNFFRKKLDGLKILPPEFNRSYNYALYTPSDSTKTKITKLHYTYWPIDFDNFATYPLRSAESAWEDLLAGKAAVIHLGYNSLNDNIIIREIYLAYYDSEKSQMFLAPIFVFEGDKEFVAYLPAVTEEELLD